jgi:hypothetical protein
MNMRIKPITVPNRPQQRTDQRDRAQRVEVALHPVDHMPTGIFDALLDQLARAVAHGQRRSQQFAQRRTRRQRFQVARIQLAGTRPLPHLFAQARRQYRLAAQGPATLEHDRQGDRRTDQDGHHRPTASHQDFQHVPTPPNDLSTSAHDSSVAPAYCGTRGIPGFIQGWIHSRQ